MGFIKRSWFKIAILLPLIPVGMLIYALGGFTGVDATLLLLATTALLAISLTWFFLGAYFEMSKGRVDEKKIKFKIGNYRFGMVEVFRVLMGIFAVGFFYIGLTVTSMSFELTDFVDSITTEQTAVRQVQRGYSFVTRADFDVHNQPAYSRIGVAVMTESQERAVEVFLSEQNFMINPVPVVFDTPHDVVNAFYEMDIEGMIIGDNFVDVFEEIEQFEHIGRDTLVLNQFYLDYEIAQRADVDLSEPFTVLLLGLNHNNFSLSSGTINVFMLLTVNLADLTFTITSVPRDSYVYVPAWGFYDKLSHTNNGGTQVAIETIEYMFDMEIPYYVKLNFTGFMEIIDVLGGIEVDVPYTFSEQDSRRRFGEHMIHVEAGLQRLNAEEALAFARHRNNYGTSAMMGDDFARVGHQQIIFEAMLREMFEQMNDVTDLLPLLGVIGEHVDTNFMSHELMELGQQLLALLFENRGTDLMSLFRLDNTIILGHNTRTPFRGGGMMYISQPWQHKIDAARERMFVNLGLMDAPFSFTFGFNGFTRVGARRIEEVVPEPPVETPWEPPVIWTPPVEETPDYHPEDNWYYPEDDPYVPDGGWPDLDNPWGVWPDEGEDDPYAPPYPDHPDNHYTPPTDPGYAGGEPQPPEDAPVHGDTWPESTWPGGNDGESDNRW